MKNSKNKKNVRNFGPFTVEFYSLVISLVLYNIIIYIDEQFFYIFYFFLVLSVIGAGESEKVGKIKKNSPKSILVCHNVLITWVGEFFV